MLKTKVGSSINPDNKLAGKEAAKSAHLNGAKVAFLFTSVVMDQKKVLAGIKEVADVPVLGCTSSAAIATQDGYFNAETGYAGMMSFSGDFEVGAPALVESSLEYCPCYFSNLTCGRDPACGPCQVGSLTGAVAS